MVELLSAYTRYREILKTNISMGALRLTAQLLCHPGKCSVDISAGDSFSVLNISQGDRALYAVIPRAPWEMFVIFQI